MRIIHLSDLHFGMHNQVIIDSFCMSLPRLNPDLIIISGDLTQRATNEHYKMLNLFINQLPVPFLAVPGNHDIPLYNLWARLNYPFKNFKNYVSKTLTTCFENNEVKILGVNSVTPYKIKDGTLNKKTINLIQNFFNEDSGQLNILFFHHNLNYFSGMHHPLNNAEELINYLKISPVDIVCTGHLHYSNLKLIPKDQSNLYAILHAGSLSCQRTKDGKNSFYIINTKNKNCTIESWVFYKNSFIQAQKDKINFKS